MNADRARARSIHAYADRLRPNLSCLKGAAIGEWLKMDVVATEKLHDVEYGLCERS